MDDLQTELSKEFQHLYLLTKVVTPPFKTLTQAGVQERFPKLTNFVYTISKNSAQKIAETLTEHRSEAHNVRIGISAILPKRRNLCNYHNFFVF